MSFVPKFYNLSDGEDDFDPYKCFWRGVGANLNLNKSNEKPSAPFKNFQDLPDREKCRQVRLKKIMGFLNKLTRDKVDLFFEKLECNDNDEHYSKMLAEILFIKVLTDEPFVRDYAVFCNKIMSSLSSGNLVCFKDVLISLCQTGIKSVFNFNDNTLELIGETKGYIFKKRIMNMMRFIGELSCISAPLFEREFIWSTAENLLLLGEELYLEAAYYLLFICLLQSDDNNWPEIVKNEVEKISRGEKSNGKVSQRLKFFFLNLVDGKNGQSSGFTPGKDKLLDSYTNNVSSTQMKQSKDIVKQKDQVDPVASQNVVLLSIKDCGTIQKPDGKLLSSRLKLLTQRVNCLKFSVNNLSSVTIISFDDIFSYDWFLINSNIHSPVEEKFLCIDLEKYKDTRFITILIECSLVRGVELFAKSHLELLKNINECNEGLLTNSWKIVEKSVKSVLNCYYLKMACLVDCNSLSALHSLKYSFKIGPDNAKVGVKHLPVINLSENPILNSCKTNNNLTTIKSSICDNLNMVGNDNLTLKMDSLRLNDIETTSLTFTSRGHAISTRNAIHEGNLKSRRKFKGNSKIHHIKHIGKNNCKAPLQKVVVEKKEPINIDEDNSCKHINNAITDPSSVMHEAKDKGKITKDLVVGRINSSSVKKKQSFHKRFKPDHSNSRTKIGCGQFKSINFEKDWRSSNDRGRCSTLENKNSIDFAKNLVKASSVSLSNAVEPRQEMSDRHCKLNELIKTKSNTSSRAVLNRESSQPSCTNKMSLSELMNFSMQTRGIKPNSLKEKGIGESSQVKQPQPKATKYLKYMDKLIIKGIFPKSSERNDEEIINLLEQYNDNLCVTDYLVICRFDHEHFAQLSFVVDEDCLEYILENNLVVNYDNETLQLQRLTSWSQAMHFNSPV